VSKALLAIGMAVALAAAVAGCGGDDDSGSTAAAPTKAQFVKEADAICAKGNEEISAQIKESGIDGEPSEAQLIEVVEEIVIPETAKQGEQISELTPPEGDEETVEEITTALAEGVAEAEEDPAAVTAGGDGPFTEATDLAKAYGLTVCGQE